MANSWCLCLIFSIVYGFLFVWTVRNSSSISISNSSNEEKELLFGFCVWGYPALPDADDGCHGEWMNSHTLSFVVDLGMTIVVVLLYVRMDDDAMTKETKQLFWALGTIIWIHGVLHALLFWMMDCYIAPSSAIPGWLWISGYVVFGLFTFGICTIILGIGFARTIGWWRIMAGGLAVTMIVVSLTYGTGTEWMLSCLFCISHLLASYAGWASCNPVFTQHMGWTFFVATLVGIVELTQCSHRLQPVGGHVWYDVFLHVSVVMALPPFAPPYCVDPEKSSK